MDFKKAFLAGAIALGTLGCEPNTTSNYEHNPIHASTESEQEVAVELPNKFKMTEDLISIGADFHIEDVNGKKVGVVQERTLNLTKTFDYIDNVGTLKAKAKESMFSWGVEICVYDSIGNVLGYIKEEVFENIFSIQTTYSILDANKNKIATSKKLDFIGTDIDIYCNNGLSISMTRPAFNIMTDTWTVNINDNKVDKRIAVFIPAYKTSADNERKAEEEEKDKE